MIELREVFKSRGQGAQRYSLAIPSLSLGAGEQLALVGASGSGKSTLLDLLAMTLSPDHVGRFDFAEHDIAALWRAGAQDRLAALRGASLGYVLQTGGLLEFLDVGSNIRLPRQVAGLAEDGSVERLAEQLGIHEHLDKRPSQLSVGQRQRVSLARALAHGPKLLLADEPTAALDPLSAEKVLDLLLARSREQGVCSVVATHDRLFAERAGLRVLSLELRRDSDGGVTATLGEAA